MPRTIVWAFRSLPELNGQTGRVECDEDLAKRLIAEGLAQDLAEGALALKEIEAAAPAPRGSNEQQQASAREYETTQLTHYPTTDLVPPAKGGRKRSR